MQAKPALHSAIAHPTENLTKAIPISDFARQLAATLPLRPATVWEKHEIDTAFSNELANQIGEAKSRLQLNRRLRHEGHVMRRCNGHCARSLYFETSTQTAITLRCSVCKCETNWMLAL